jgi:hypothetical protein
MKINHLKISGSHLLGPYKNCIGFHDLIVQHSTGYMIYRYCISRYTYRLKYTKFGIGLLPILTFGSVSVMVWVLTLGFVTVMD